MSRIRKLLGLSGEQKLLLLTTAAYVTIVSAGLKFLGFARVKKVLEQLSTHWGRLPNSQTTHSVKDLVRSVEISSRYILGGDTCLVRALVLKTMLHRQAVSCDLVIGVRMTAEKGIAAHAWIAQEGNILIGKSNAFEPLGSIPFD